MSDTTTGVYRMPYEGNATSVEDAAASLLQDEDSVEEHTEDLSESETESHEEEVEPAEEAEEAKAEESEDEETSDDEDEESEDTRDDADTPADDPVSEKEKLLQADYTRKTQALAEQRKALEVEAEQVRATREQYAERLAAMEEVLASLAPPEPDWNALRASDPAEYAAQRLEHQQRQADLAAVQHERRRLAEEAAQEQRTALEAHLAAEAEKLVEAIPEWKDAEKAKSEKAALVEYVKGMGFTEEEVGSVYDHRLLVLIRKAARYDELTTKGAAKVAEHKTVAKVLKPGGRDTSPNAGKRVESKILADKLKRSGSVDDAAALFLAQDKGR